MPSSAKKPHEYKRFEGLLSKVLQASHTEISAKLDAEKKLRTQKIKSSVSRAKGVSAKED